MSIREWYGFKNEYDATLGINSSVDGLLELYSKAIMRYFSVQADSYEAILNINPNQLTHSQKLFHQWLSDKGFPYLIELASKHLPNDEHLVSKIDYDKYILEEEMGFEYPEDLRSSLISIVNDIPDYIAASTEVSVSVTVEDIWDNWYTLLTEPQVSFNQEEVFLYKVEENEYIMSNYKESAINAGSLFVYWGKLYGNNGILQVN